MQTLAQEMINILVTLDAVLGRRKLRRSRPLLVLVVIGCAAMFLGVFTYGAAHVSASRGVVSVPVYFMLLDASGILLLAGVVCAGVVVLSQSTYVVLGISAIAATFYFLLEGQYVSPTAWLKAVPLFSTGVLCIWRAGVWAEKETKAGQPSVGQVSSESAPSASPDEPSSSRSTEESAPSASPETVT